ncbi:hypothetical protein pb186bvf_004959 [Paramecium bursaria]
MKLIAYIPQCGFVVVFQKLIQSVIRFILKVREKDNQVIYVMKKEQKLNGKIKIYKIYNIIKRHIYYFFFILSLEKNIQTLDYILFSGKKDYIELENNFQEYNSYNQIRHLDSILALQISTVIQYIL